MTGFKLRLREKSARYLMVAKLDGRARRFTLGDARSMPAAQARAIAKDYRNQIMAGIDPAAQPVTSVTFAEIAARYRDRWAAGRLARQKVPPRPQSVRSHDSDARRAFVRFGDVPVAAIDTAACRRVLSALEGEDVSPAVRRRAFGALAVILRFAVGEGVIDQNPAMALERPATSLSRDRFLSRSEIAAIWDACDGLGPAGHLVRFLIAMPVRTGIARSMRRDWIDGDLLCVPAACEGNKAGRDLLLPLTRQAIEIAAGQGSQCFVFAGRAGTRLTLGSKIKAELDAGSGVANWRFHDFRRTAVSLAADADAGLDTTAADAWLGHTISGVAAVYQRAQRIDAMRKVAAVWSGVLGETVS